MRGIVADGGTRHEEALWMALKLQPDVIFFLTDADQPELSPAQLEKIHRTNNGRCSINTIEFGLGPPIHNDNFLVRLARENNGKYTYVDVSKGRASIRKSQRRRFCGTFLLLPLLARAVPLRRRWR